MLAGVFPSLPLTLIDTDTLMHCKHPHAACVCMCVLLMETQREKKAGENDGGGDRVSTFLCYVHVSRRV